MLDHEAFPRPKGDAYGLHEAAARGRAVTGPSVDVPGVEAERAVVAIAAVLQRRDCGSAVRAREANVLVFPSDCPDPREMEELQLEGSGFRTFSLVPP
jgi:hypothetical protein